MTTETTTYICRDCGASLTAAEAWLEPRGRNSYLGPPIPFCRDIKACWDRIIWKPRKDALARTAEGAGRML